MVQDYTKMTGAFNKIENDLKAKNALDNYLPVHYGVTNNDKVTGVPQKVIIVEEYIDDKAGEVKPYHIDQHLYTEVAVDGKDGVTRDKKTILKLDANIRDYVFLDPNEPDEKKRKKSTPIIDLPEFKDTKEMLKFFEEQYRYMEAMMNTMKIAMITDSEIANLDTTYTGLSLYRSLVNGTSTGISLDQYQQIQKDEAALANLNAANFDYNTHKQVTLIKDRITIQSVRQTIKTLRDLHKYFDSLATSAKIERVEPVNGKAQIVNQKTVKPARIDTTNDASGLKSIFTDKVSTTSLL